MSQAHAAGKATQPAGNKGDRTRRHILDTAAAVIAVAGTVDVNLTDIARAAGLKSASLYFHFSSRDDLVAEVLAVGMEAAIEHLERALETAGTSAAARLRAAVGAHLDARLELNDYAAVVLGVRRRPGYPRSETYESLRRAYIRCWLDLIADAQAATALPAALAPRLVCDLILGALNADLGGKYSSAVAADAVVALIGLG